MGDQVGFAFTEDLTLESMTKAARSAAAIAKGRPVDLPRNFGRKQFSNYYSIPIPWSEVGINDKLPVLNRLAQHAKAQDPTVQKVSASWKDSESRVLIADLSGNISADIMASVH